MFEHLLSSSIAVLPISDFHLVSIASHEVSFNARAYFGISIASHEVSIASHEVSIASHEVSIASHEVSIASHEVSIASHEVSFNSAKPDKLPSGKHEITFFSDSKPSDNQLNPPSNGQLLKLASEFVNNGKQANNTPETISPGKLKNILAES
jgi:hypothetical protein